MHLMRVLLLLLLQLVRVLGSERKAPWDASLLQVGLEGWELGVAAGVYGV